MTDAAEPTKPKKKAPRESPEAIATRIEQRLETLPVEPGCYLFRDRKGTVVYVGKARNLRARVRQYFQANSSDYRYFVPLLQRVLGEIETVVTATEKEAVLLEDSLIKEHKPRYNVRLRDDKSYLSLRLDKKQPWPRLEMVRRPNADGASYFGPYPNGTSARRALRLVNRHFQLRTCDDAYMASRARPCLEYQIKRCSGPCVLPVDRAEYGAQVRFVELFLEGRSDELAKQLEGTMKDAARALEFERAGRLRDQLTAVRQVQEQQRVSVVSDTDQDIFGLYREGDVLALCVLVVRAGFVRDTQRTVLSRVEVSDAELIAAFLSQRYENSPAGRARIPDEVLVPVLPEAVEGLVDLLTERRGRAVEVLVPQRGPRVKLLEMARDNAQHAFRERRAVESTAQEHAEALQERLGLSLAPRSIECVDISHHLGSETVGAIVCLKDGAPFKKNYRSFYVQGEDSGNDYNAMNEVLRRRFKRGKAGEEGWDLPDLFVVDGGRGQLNVALTVLKELGITTLAVAALAKERETVTGDKMVDRVYMPGRKNPIAIDRHQAALVMLARARDEAHRFANRVREDLHHRRRLRSALDDVPGVGTKTRVALLRALGTVDGVQNASVDELARVPGVGATKARQLFAALHHDSQLAPEPADSQAGPDEP